MYRIMEQVISESEEKGMEQGIKQGIKQGIEQGLLDSIRSVMTKLKVDIDESMDILDIPIEKRNHFAQLIE